MEARELSKLSCCTIAYLTCNRLYNSHFCSFLSVWGFLFFWIYPNFLRIEQHNIMKLFWARISSFCRDWFEEVLWLNFLRKEEWSQILDWIFHRMYYARICFHEWFDFKGAKISYDFLIVSHLLEFEGKHELKEFHLILLWKLVCIRGRLRFSCGVRTMILQFWVIFLVLRVRSLLKLMPASFHKFFISLSKSWLNTNTNKLNIISHTIKFHIFKLVI